MLGATKQVEKKTGVAKRRRCASLRHASVSPPSHKGGIAQRRGSHAITGVAFQASSKIAIQASGKVVRAGGYALGRSSS
jgi:hypothetical protein